MGLVDYEKMQKLFALFYIISLFRFLLCFSILSIKELL